MSRYGNCCKCGSGLEPIWFEQPEVRVVMGTRIPTGRVRQACSHLTCPTCLHNECVDDTFDGAWHYKSR